MKSTQKTQKAVFEPAVRWILAGLASITLYFQTNLADPFNSPKMWLLLFIASYLLGYILKSKGTIFSSKDFKITFFIIIVFISTSLVVTLLTDFKQVALFGDTFRKNGFLAYISLSVVFVASFLFIRFSNVFRIIQITGFIALVTITYGTLQTLGKDFVDWINPHNALIGTQGNPNFAAAAMAIMGVILISSVFVSNIALYQRYLAIILAFLLLILIYRSNARQGLISFAIGLGVFFVILLFGRSKKMGIASMFVAGSVFILAVLGMLQVGPLQQLLYKPSVTVRGYYWRAAVDMFTSNPIFGVGMDRYGSYFMQYRDVGYPLNYGFEITSSNAHNTFLQFFSTGGALLGGSYLLLVIWIITRAVKGLKAASGDNRVVLAGIFAAWIAFQAQSFVSIDNLGLAIWGWILGGTIIGLSYQSTSHVTSTQSPRIQRVSQIDLTRVLTSGIATLLTVVLIAILYRGENNAFKASFTVGTRDQAAIAAYRDAQLKVIQAPLIDQSYSLKSAVNLIEFGLSQDGYSALLNLHSQDPRNLDVLNSLAGYHEFKNELDQAIMYREKIAKLNPWNAVNYLLLGQDYKKSGNLEKSQEMLEKILSFATGANGGPIAEQAQKELAQ